MSIIATSPKVLIAIVSIAIATMSCGSEPNSKPDEPLRIKVPDSILLERKVPGFLNASIDGLKLPAGKTCVVEATFENTLNQALDFHGGETDCGCSSAVLSPNHCEPGAKAVLELT